jgi:phage major head subunit gpT-like protein
MRKRPNRLIRLDREEDENVFMNRQFIYGTDGRAEVAFAMPHLIYFSEVD